MKPVFSRRHIALAMGICAPSIAPVYAADTGTQSAPILQTIKISGEYVTERTLTGSKMDLPIREIPQTISVVTKDQIEIQAAQSLDQALRYTAGVAAATGGATRTTDEVFSLRGFDDRSNSTIYVDGSKSTRNIYSGTTEPYGFERIEVLKGPASALYGRAAPGGIINLVSKKPTVEPLREIKLQAGTNDHAQVAADFSDKIDSNGVWSYRVTGLYREADTEVDEIPDDRTFIAPVLRFQPSENTSLILRAEYKQDDTMFNYGLPFEGTVDDNPNGDIDPQRFIGEKDLDEWDSKNRSIGYQFEHKFNDVVTIRQNFHRFWADVDYTYSGFGAWSDDLTTVDRTLAIRNDEDSGFSIDTALQFTLQTGDVTQSLLVGVDRVEGKFTREQNRLPINPLNLYNPVYGRSAVDPAGGFSTVEGNDLRQTGIYLQDHIKIGKRVVVSAGVRRDDVTLSTDYSEIGYAEAFDEDSDATTFNGGFVFLADHGISPYVSYSESFQPNAGLDANDEQYDPAEGDQIEYGIKYRPDDAKIEVTLSRFDINQKDVIVNSFAGYGGGNQIDVDSKGFELETHAHIGEDLSIIAAYTRVDAEVAKSDIANQPGTHVRYEKGNRTAAQPKDAASLWVDYSLPMLRTLTLAAGVQYVGDTTDFSNQYEVPSYTLFDAAVRFDIENWRLALNVKNLSDKEYVAACTYACYYGDGRTAVATATYQW